jgi:hypothetical protein
MAILHASGRAACVVALAAAIVIAPIVGMGAGAGGFRVVADPCTQVSSNGSVSLQCGSQSVGSSGGYRSGCTNAYGTYQNCIVQLGPPGSRR